MARQGGAKYSKEKYQERILHEMNMFLRRDVGDPRLAMATITHVQLSRDYSSAKIYWDTFQAEHKEEIDKAIKGAAGKIRTLLAKVLEVRHTPELVFFYNSQFEDELKIENLINNQPDEEE